MDEFKRIAVGDVQQEFVNELKEKFKSKFEQFKYDNEKQSSVSLPPFQIWISE